MCQDAMLQPRQLLCVRFFCCDLVHIYIVRESYITDEQQSIGFKRISSRLTEKEMSLATNSRDTPKQTEARFKEEERAREGAQGI